MNTLTVCVFFTGAFAVLPLHAEDIKPLPNPAEETLQKLADWEAEQIENTRSAIQAKRVQVIALLQEAVKKATRQGDLDSAIIIKGEIDRLIAEKVVITLNTPVRPAGDGWTSESLTGTIWNLEDESRVTLHHGGVLELRSNDGKVLKKDTWYLREDGVLEFRWDGRPTHKETVILNPDGRSGTYGSSKEVNFRLVGRSR